MKTERISGPCPRPDSWRALAAGEVPNPEAEHLRRHLAGCSTCSAAYDAQTVIVESAVALIREQRDAERLARQSPTIVQPVPLPDRGETLDVDCDFARDTTRTIAGDSSITPVGPDPRSQRAPLQRRFGDYELLSEIARGGMGVVYKARQLQPERLVALKMILSGKLATEHDIRRFYAEAEAAAQLDHQGIVPIFEIGEHEGQHFFSMAFIDGCNLAERVSMDGPLAPREAAELVREITDAVAYAHERNIVHRDLKPANVLISNDGRARITDFGLARRTDIDRDMTATGQIIGTPSYMSPEQAAGKTDEVGPESDIYSLGAILYFLLTGRPPFQAASIVKTLEQVINNEPVSSRLLNPAIDRDLDTVCLKCLEKSPNRRYATARELAEDLQRFLNDEPVAARRVTGVERLWRWGRRNPRTAGLIGLSALVVLLLVTGFLFHRQSEQWKLEADWQAQLTRIQSRLANQQSELARRNEELAQLATAMKHLSRAGELASRKRLGWSWEAVDELQQAVQLAGDRLDPLHVNSLAAASLSAQDIRLVEVIKVGGGSGVEGLAFSPDSRLLALAQDRGTPTSSVFLYDVEQRKQVGALKLSTAFDNLSKFGAEVFLKGNLRPKFQEGPTCVAFSPDGVWLAAGMRSGKINVWNRQDTDPKPQTLSDLEGGFIGQLRFSATGKELFASRKDGTLGITQWVWKDGWSAGRKWPSAGTTFELHPRTGQLVHIAKQLQLDSVASELPGWSRETKDELASIGVSPRYGYGIGAVRAELTVFAADHWRNPAIVAFSDMDARFREDTPQFVDSRAVVALNASDEWIRCIDLAAGKPLFRISSHGRYDAPFVTSPNGRWMAITGNGETYLYEIRDASVETTLEPQTIPIADFALSPDGQSLSFSTVPHTDVLLDESIVQTVSLGDSLVSGVGTEARVSRAKMFSPGPRFRFPFSDITGTLAYHPLDGSIAVTCGLLGLHRIDSHGQQFWMEQLRSDGEMARTFDEGQLTALGTERPLPSREDSGAWRGKVWVLTPTGVPRVKIQLPITPDVTRREDLVVAARVRATQSALPPATMSVQFLGRTENTSLSADGYEWVQCGVLEAQAAATPDQMILELGLDPATTAELLVDQLALIPCHSYQNDATKVFRSDGPMVFAPDGKRLYAICDADQLSTWDVDSGKLRASFSAAVLAITTGKSTISCLAASRELVAVGSESGQLALLTADTLEPRATWRGPGGDISALAFTADGTQLAVGTASGKIRLYATKDGAVVADVDRHVARVTSLAFQASGDVLWSCSHDGSIRQWSRREAAWVEQLTLLDGDIPVEKIAIDAAGRRLALLKQGERAVRVVDLEELRRRTPQGVRKDEVENLEKRS